MAATHSTSKKLRLVDIESRVFNPLWRENYLFVERFGKPQCLICLAVTAVFKEYSIKRHWELNQTKTSKYAARLRIKDASQLAVFIRGVTTLFTIVEEFVELMPLRGRTTGLIVETPPTEKHKQSSLRDPWQRTWKIESQQSGLDV